MAARQELVRAVNDDLCALACAEDERAERNGAVVRALRDIPAAVGALFGARWEREDSYRYEEALDAAYPVEGLEDLTDRVATSFDYRQYRRRPRGVVVRRARSAAAVPVSDVR